MQDNVIDEYLMLVKPSFDANAWKQASGQISTALTKPFDIVSKKYDKKLLEAKEQLKKLAKEGENLKKKLGDKNLSEEDKKSLGDKLKNNKKLQDKQNEAIVKLTNKQTAATGKTAAFAKGMGIASIFLSLFTAAIQKAKDEALKLAKVATKYSNQFITQSSMFVNTDTRDVMGKFGVNAKTAQSLTAVSSQLNIDLSDYSKLTYGQRKAFSDLMQHYQAGLDSIDPTKLDKFNKATQEYQLMQAKFNLDLQLSITKMLAESDGASGVLKTLTGSLEDISKILSSDAVATGFDFIMGIINGILKFATTPLNWLGNLFAGSSSTTTNKTATVNTTINSYGGTSPEQLAIDIGMQVQGALG